MLRTASIVKRFALVASMLLLFASAQAAQQSFSKIQHGRYLVKAGDCTFCHTADGGKPYAGGRPIETPFGIIYSTNITPDEETGIGNWSEQDFYNAMHLGIDNQGEHLYPAFPYPWFTRMSRDDIDAIKAFLDIIDPVHQENKPLDIPWPLSWRASMAGWNMLFFEPGEFHPDPQKSEQWNRGAYLVQGAGHCSACHAEKNLFGAVKNERALDGAPLSEHWYVASLSGNRRNGIGDWSEDDIVEYLKTGANDKAAATGPMTDVVVHSTQYLKEEDLRAIAVYLKDAPEDADKNDSTASLSEDALARGEAVYFDNCTGCHMHDGRGQKNAFPPLAGNPTVQAEHPDTLIHIVLSGARMPETGAKPTGLAMPAFSWKLSDRQITDVLNYIRNTWDNHAAPISINSVAQAREAIKGTGDVAHQ